MTRRGDVVAYRVAGVAILAFAVLLVFALFRLFDTEAEMRRIEEDNMLWTISQARSAALLLDAAVARRAGVPGSTADIDRRYNVLLSRLTLLSEGPQARYMAGLGFAETLAARARAIRRLEAGIVRLQPGDTETAASIHVALAPLAQELGRAANQSMVTHWDATGARLDRYRAAIVQVIVSILAIVLLGIFLSFTMLRAMADKQRIQYSLVREQEFGEAYRSFVALISHQFRTPLAVIDSSMQRILRQEGTISRAETGERAKRVRTEVQGLTQLIETTLDAIRLDASQIEPDPKNCGLGDLVERVRVRQTEATPHRKVDLHIGDEVPPWIETDPLLAEQVLGNLLSNAVKYSPGNEPVSVRVRAENGYIRFAVEDHGIGIPEDEQGKLFGRFFRASTAGGTPGSGIGLSVSYQLARLLRGKLSFVSRAGIGSTFTLRLPIEWARPDAERPVA